MQKTHRNRGNRTMVCALVCAAAMGCRKSGDPPDPATNGNSFTETTIQGGSASQPTNAPTIITFNDKKDGVQFQYTSEWVPKSDKDYVLQILPAKDPGDRRITFDVPDLPPHFPGMIRLGLIENGYVNDLKKDHKDAHTDNSADYPLGQGATARLVESSWAQNGGTHKDLALLIMRNDHVYILACGSDAPRFAATRVDFEKVMASLKWTK